MTMKQLGVAAGIALLAVAAMAQEEVPPMDSVPKIGFEEEP